jgi:uncharacterized protein (TIGR02466 family)
MSTRAWFSTLIYHHPLWRRGPVRFNADLADECRRLRDLDAAGRRWCARHYPGGYTSYATFNQLHKFSSTFAALERRIRTHVRRFARQLDLDLTGREVFMTDFWVNIMPRHAAHSLHLHPLAFISGTYYVATPPGCPGLKFEDPRLDRFMAAPPRRPGARPANRTHVTYPARAGHLILFESWLRHAVEANPTDSERISVSFNYNWS